MKNTREQRSLVVALEQWAALQRHRSCHTANTVLPSVTKLLGRASQLVQAELGVFLDTECRLSGPQVYGLTIDNMFPIIIELRKKGPPAGAALKGMPGNPFLYEKDRAILKALGSKLRLVATAETQQQNANMPCNEVLHGQVPVLAAQMHLMVQEPVSCPEAATAVGAAVARARAEGSVAASTGRKGGSYVYKKRVVSALVTLQSNPAGGRPRLVAALLVRFTWMYRALTALYTLLKDSAAELELLLLELLPELFVAAMLNKGRLSQQVVQQVLDDLEAAGTDIHEGFTAVEAQAYQQHLQQALGDHAPITRSSSASSKDSSSETPIQCSGIPIPSSPSAAAAAAAAAAGIGGGGGASGAHSSAAGTCSQGGLVHDEDDWPVDILLHEFFDFALTIKTTQTAVSIRAATGITELAADEFRPQLDGALIIHDPLEPQQHSPSNMVDFRPAQHVFRHALEIMQRRQQRGSSIAQQGSGGYSVQQRATNSGSSNSPPLTQYSNRVSSMGHLESSEGSNNISSSSTTSSGGNDDITPGSHHLLPQLEVSKLEECVLQGMRGLRPATAWRRPFGEQLVGFCMYRPLWLAAEAHKEAMQAESLYDIKQKQKKRSQKGRKRRKRGQKASHDPAVQKQPSLSREVIRSLQKANSLSLQAQLVMDSQLLPVMQVVQYSRQELSALHSKARKFEQQLSAVAAAAGSLRRKAQSLMSEAANPTVAPDSMKQQHMSELQEEAAGLMKELQTQLGPVNCLDPNTDLQVAVLTLCNNIRFCTAQAKQQASIAVAYMAQLFDLECSGAQATNAGVPCAAAAAAAAGDGAAGGSPGLPPAKRRRLAGDRGIADLQQQLEERDDDLGDIAPCPVDNKPATADTPGTLTEQQQFCGEDELDYIWDVFEQEFPGDGYTAGAVAEAWNPPIRSQVQQQQQQQDLMLQQQQQQQDLMLRQQQQQQLQQDLMLRQQQQRQQDLMLRQLQQQQQQNLMLRQQQQQQLQLIQHQQQFLYMQQQQLGQQQQQHPLQQQQQQQQRQQQQRQQFFGYGGNAWGYGGGHHPFY